MDGKQFEALSRRVAAAGSRRGALRALAVGLILPSIGMLRSEEAEAGIPIVSCKPPGKKCDKNKRCCSGRCKGGHCLCSKRGRTCWQPLEGALCCSRRCNGGKCA